MNVSTVVRGASSILGRAIFTPRGIERLPRVAFIAHRSIASSQIRRQEATTAEPERVPQRSLTDGLDDPPPVLDENEKQVDWTRSFHGLSAAPFSSEQTAVLQQELDPEDVEIKPDGILYLPEIKYRRILNKAFSPGGWGLAPRGETIVTAKLVTREYGLVVNGRLVSIARGEQVYFEPDGIPTATEGCKSNALMRCCKDLGIASELWDPRYIRNFMKTHSREIMVEHQVTKKRRKHFMRKDDTVRYPFKEVSPSSSPPSRPSYSRVCDRQESSRRKQLYDLVIPTRGHCPASDQTVYLSERRQNLSTPASRLHRGV